MIEINLIPDVKRELIKAQRTRGIVISSSIIAGIIAISIVVILAIYVFGAQTVRNNIADATIEEKGAELLAVEDLSKMLTLQNQLEVISSVNSVKNIDSRVFDMLAALIPPSPNEAQISQISLDSEAMTVRIEGQTRSFDSMEVFTKTIDAAVLVYDNEGEEMQVKLATEIATSDTSYGEDSDGNKKFRFVLSFVYPEELFDATIDEVNFKLIVNGNVTDSYLGIPKTIFAEPVTELEEGE